MFTVAKTQEAYDKFANSYPTYADGEGFFDLNERLYAYSDIKLFKKIIHVIEISYEANRYKPVRILDSGCGPGTWLIRIADFCYKKGIEFQGVGIDISNEMIRKSHENLAKYRSEYPNNKINLEFMIGDITKKLPYENKQFDITMSLYTVLNHIPKEVLPLTISEMARVTRSLNIITVRCFRSQPTAFVGSWDVFRNHHYDPANEILTLLTEKGELLQLQCHLFSYEELKMHLQRHGRIRECLGLDVVVSRFVRFSWHSETTITPELLELEEMLCNDPRWFDSANHLLVITEMSCN